MEVAQVPTRKPTGLMDLPLELRQMIYGHCVFPYGNAPRVRINLRPEGRVPPIAQVSRESRAWTLPLYYTEGVFIIDDLFHTPNIDSWVEAARIENIKKIRYMTFQADNVVNVESPTGVSRHRGYLTISEGFDFSRTAPRLGTQYKMRVHGNEHLYCPFVNGVPGTLTVMPPHRLITPTLARLHEMRENCARLAANYLAKKADPECIENDLAEGLFALWMEMVFMKNWISTNFRANESWQVQRILT